MTVTLEVFGKPFPQGSKTRMPSGAMVDGTSPSGRRKLADWRQAVTRAAGEAVAEHGRFTGPVEVAVTFRFPLPKSDPYRTLHAQAPDVDKLARAVFDGVAAGGLLANDALVYQLHARKVYCADGEAPGATIELTDQTRAEQVAREALKARAKDARRRPAQASLAGVDA